jgi:hypothetical protein
MHLGVIWIISLGSVPIFSMINNREVIYPCLFRQCVSIILQHALAFTIERKIMLAGDACSRPPITIKSHNLHVGDIREVVGEIAFYHKRD